MDAYASVSFVDGTFIVGGVQGEFRSTDGYTWGFVSASERRHFAYGNGRFVALTEAGAVYGSTDGSTWYDGPTMGAPNRAIAFGEPAAP